MTPEVSTILFAIRAGVQLFGAGRRAHADAIRGKHLVLPLPKAGVDGSGAQDFFELTNAGQRAREEAGGERLEFLLNKDPRSAEEEKELAEIYLVLRAIYEPVDVQPRDNQWSPEELSAVFTLRQWAKEAPAGHAPPIQTVAGTLVNIAVGYFISTPGAVNPDRPEGRAIRAFLEAISGTDFSQETLASTAPGLFVALLDSASAHPDLIAGGPKEKEFVTNVTKSLSGTITKALEGTTAADRKAFFDDHWPELIARAFFEGGAQTILAHPRTYLGTGGDESKVVSAVTTTFTGLALKKDGLDLRAAVSHKGLEQMVKAALVAIADNPGIIDLGDDQEGLEQVIVQTIAALPTQDNLLSADLAPRLVELVLRQSAANLALILNHDGKDPRKNLVIVAAGTVLTALADNSTKGWNPPLTQTQVMLLLETVTEEVLANPDWLVRQLAGTDSVLKVALEAALASLREAAKAQPGTRALFNNETLLASLRTALKAVGNNLTLLIDLPKPDGTGNVIALRLVLDIVLIALRDIPQSEEQIRWRLANNRVATALVEIALLALARHGASQGHVDALRDTVGKLINGDIQLDQFPDELEHRLDAPA